MNAKTLSEVTALVIANIDSRARWNGRQFVVNDTVIAYVVSGTDFHGTYWQIIDVTGDEDKYVDSVGEAA